MYNVSGVAAPQFFMHITRCYKKQKKHQNIKQREVEQSFYEKTYVNHL